MAPRDPYEAHTSTPRELQAFNAMKRRGEPFIGFRDGQERLQLRALVAGAQTLTIGRAETSTIALTWDPKVSSLHAELTPVDAEWVIADDGLSKNGTYVAGDLVRGRRRLRDEDRILVGASVMVFHAGTLRRIETEIAGERVVRRTDLNENDQRVLDALCAPLFDKTSDVAATNEAIADQVYLTIDGVKRCLTRMYQHFEITEAPKRTRLAKRAIAYGVADPAASEAIRS